MQISVSDVFDIAIHIERNGTFFYRKAAGLVKDDETKKWLSTLARMEEEHREVFIGLKEIVDDDVIINEGVASYLGLFASGQVFDMRKDINDLQLEHMGVKEVLKFAIEREKESILLYSGLMQAISNDKYSDEVNRIISEEMDHVAILTEKLKFLK